MILAPTESNRPRRALLPAEILVVEDDPAVRSSMRFSLEAEGYRVRIFANAGALLAEPDLPLRGCLVCDYFLPDGNGLDLIRTLRGRGVELPAILVTTAPDAALWATARQNHVRIVEKPLIGDALSLALQAVIAAGGS